MIFSRRSRWLAALAAALMGVMVAADVADARAGRGGGFGMRGGRSFEAPPATRTAPREAAPLQRQQQPGPAVTQAQPRAAATAPRAGFARSGLLGGLIGAGLIGMLLGYGFFGGLGGLAAMFGLLLQLALIAGLVMLVMRFFRSRQPAFAGAPPQRPASGAPHWPGFGGSTGRAASRRRAGDDEVGIGQEDLDSFERILGEVQDAYSRGDRAALRALALPEVSQRLERELDDDAARNLVNKVGDVKLLQGDLAEAWREGSSDYATVAMRFALKDHVEDRTTGRIVEGDPGRLTEATEIWTFRRDAGGPWRVSAIQVG